jgi:hypothetical protein
LLPLQILKLGNESGEASHTITTHLEKQTQSSQSLTCTQYTQRARNFTYSERIEFWVYDIRTPKCRASIICKIALIVKKENYLWFATIGIENPHGIVSAIDARHHKYHPVSTNAKVPITQLHGLFRCDLRL